MGDFNTPLSILDRSNRQTKLHKRRRNKILYEQAIAEGFHHHQSCFTRAPERSSKHRKEQSVPAIPKMYQMVKSINTMKKLHQLTGKKPSYHQNGMIKFTHNNITLKCKLVKYPNKRHRLANWIKHQNPLMCCIQETHLTGKDTHRLKIKEWRKQMESKISRSRNPSL